MSAYVDKETESQNNSHEVQQKEKQESATKCGKDLGTILILDSSSDEETENTYKEVETEVKVTNEMRQLY